MSDDHGYFEQFNFEPTSPNSVCIYMYLVGTAVAAWQWCERGRLAARCEQQLRPITRHNFIKRPLLLFARLLTCSFALRAFWFLLNEAEFLKPACTPVTTANDCSNVVADAFSRGSQFVFFTAFSLIATFWIQWGVGFDAEDSAAAGESGVRADDQRARRGTAVANQPCTLCGMCRGRRRVTRCNAGFLVLCLWMFLLQVAAVLLKTIHTADASGREAPVSRFLFKTYSVMLSITYTMLTLGMGLGGCWLRWRLKTQIADHEQWQARHTFQSDRPRRLPNPSAVHHAAFDRGTDGGLAHSRNARTGGAFAVVAPRALGVRTGPGITASQQAPARLAGMPPRTTDLLRRAVCRVTTMQVVCVVLFFMRALLFSFSPLFGIDVSEDKLVYPWLFYPIPELVPGLLLLGTTAPDPRRGCCCCGRGGRPRQRHRKTGRWCSCCRQKRPSEEGTRLVSSVASYASAAGAGPGRTGDRPWDDADSDTSDETVNSLNSSATAPLGASDVDALRFACRIDADRELRPTHTPRPGTGGPHGAAVGESDWDSRSEGRVTDGDDDWYGSTYEYAPPSPTWTVNSAKSVHV